MCILSSNPPPSNPHPPCHTYLYVPVYCISCYSATTKVCNGLSRQCYHLDQTASRNGYVVHRAWSRAQQ